MSDNVIQLSDPKQLAELLEQVNGLKELFSNVREQERARAKRGKILAALHELRDAELPFITLNRNTFKNKSVASMRSQFKRTAEENNVGFEPSLVEYDGELILVNFDNEFAEQKFNTYIMKRAGVDEKELQKIAADLDSNTKK